MIMCDFSKKNWKHICEKLIVLTRIVFLMYNYCMISKIRIKIVFYKHDFFSIQSNEP